MAAEELGFKKTSRNFVGKRVLGKTVLLIRERERTISKFMRLIDKQATFTRSSRSAYRSISNNFLQRDPFPRTKKVNFICGQSLHQPIARVRSI